MLFTQWLKLKIEDDVEVIQSAETTDKAPILNNFELLVPTPSVENEKDGDDNKIN